MHFDGSTWIESYNAFYPWRPEELACAVQKRSPLNPKRLSALLEQEIGVVSFNAPYSTMTPYSAHETCDARFTGHGFYDIDLACGSNPETLVELCGFAFYRAEPTNEDFRSIMLEEAARFVSTYGSHAQKMYSLLEERSRQPSLFSATPIDRDNLIAAERRKKIHLVRAG